MEPKRIFEASLTGDITKLHSLLSEDPFLLDRVTLNSVETPLHISCMAGQTEITKKFLSLRPKWAQELNQQGLSPLHMASANGHVEIVKEIVSVVGANICRLKGQDGKVSLHFAAMKGQVSVLRELVSACPESVSEVTVGEESVLHLAVKNNQFEAVRVLIEELRKLGKMEIVNWKDIEGNTTIDLLIGDHDAQEAGGIIINTNPVNTTGFTPRDVLDLILQNDNTTMTYQAILSPPSGFSNNTPVDYYSKNDAVLINTKSALNVGEGEAVMASDPHVFVIFTVFNAIGFFASLGMISVLTSGFPLRAGLRLAILSMVATYVIAVFYEAPTKMRTVFVVLWLMGLVVLFELGRFGFWLLRKCGILKFSRRSSPPSLDGYPHDQQNNHHQLDF
ncbi:hypothetical protein G4B88_015299 [Cannabis sativa]|uniref:PGG domain-containing protein n=1 Tax=Cannabis sativa TaxID=3483 RepID=A0A7J6EDE0_CANSA|nr:hypothetical protein G4B88_015299 [Cannabis sativa]